MRATEASKAKPSKARATKDNPTKAKSTEAKSTEAKSTEAKSSKAKSSKAKSGKAKSTKTRATKTKSSKDFDVDRGPNDNFPSKTKPVIWFDNAEDRDLHDRIITGFRIDPVETERQLRECFARCEYEERAAMVKTDNDPVPIPTTENPELDPLLIKLFDRLKVRY